MTDPELRDQAVAELRQTTVGYLSNPAKGGCKHDWILPPGGTHWANALDLLAKIGEAPPPPPPITGFPGWTVPPVPAGATVVTSGAQLLSLFRGGSTGNYDATALTARFADRVIIDAHCPDGSPAVFWLGPNVTFAGASLRTDPAAEAVGAQNVTVYGGDLSNPIGAGFNVRGRDTANPGERRSAGAGSLRPEPRRQAARPVRPCGPAGCLMSAEPQRRFSVEGAQQIAGWWIVLDRLRGRRVAGFFSRKRAQEYARWRNAS